MEEGVAEPLSTSYADCILIVIILKNNVYYHTVNQKTEKKHIKIIYNPKIKKSHQMIQKLCFWDSFKRTKSRTQIDTYASMLTLCFS